MSEKFTHDGQEFEIRSFNDGVNIRVKAFLNNQQFGPEYSASFEVNSDHIKLHGEHIINVLKTQLKSCLLYTSDAADE